MSESDIQEAILFFEGSEVTKQMMYAEFEAILDGVVGIPEFCDVAIKAVYIEVDEFLEVKSCVTFLIEFDEDGYAAINWNIPLRKLAYQAKYQETVQSQSVRVVTQEYCPIKDYRMELWNFEDLIDTETILSRIITTVELNTLCLPGKKRDRKEAPSEGVSALGQAASGGADAQMVLNPQYLHTMATIQGQQAPVVVQQVPAPHSPAEETLKQEIARLTDRHLQEIELLKQQSKQELQTMQDHYDRLVVEHVEHIGKLKQKVEEFEARNEVLSAQSQEKGSEMQVLQKMVDKKLPAIKRNYKAQLKEMKRKYETKVEALTAQIVDVNADMVEKLEEWEKRNKQLTKELSELRRDKFRLMNGGTDEFFEKIRVSGLKMTAYHLGTGHITIPLEDLGEYIEDTNEYIANKCGVSVEHYAAWLVHAQEPACDFDIGGGRSCGAAIVKTEHPRDFKEGVSDRCIKHRTIVGAQPNANHGDDATE